jgi:hypothetical protein
MPMPSIHRRGFLLAASLAGLGACGPSAGQPGYNVGDPLAPGKPRPGAAGHRLLTWEDLVPPGWDPMKGFDMRAFSQMRDGDPRAQAALDQLKRAWDDAPVRPELDGVRVRLPGFIVPLDVQGQGMRQFLLVPYFGACIHTPPPPANQVVHVLLAQADKRFGSMDAVWVNGVMQVAVAKTAMGAAGYRIEGAQLLPYERR